ncbi:MAG: glutamate-5-semialdehyde dehydrogenase [Deltaproteobacteria bacterium]|nr:glutamate-5-semialdehyde dehydrogenase [Myxococcales bacterium]MCZ6568942.1 glutamate-5-semialdehyde dehydrogenase [Deltaproteobacteria bacterium]
MSFQALAEEIAVRARAAANRVAELPSDVRGGALQRAADCLESSCEAILESNAKDLEAAHESGLAAPLRDRLTLDLAQVQAMARGLRDIASLPDPVGEITGMWTRPNGLRVGRMRIPLGVIFVIYESRPNVTTDVAGLCLKSGNATLLRGGSEAFHTNSFLAELFRGALRESGIPEDVIQLVPHRERELVDLLLEREDEIDLVIPRGGEGLIRHVAERSRIPVIKHYKGVCHVYLDRHAEPKMARDITINSKCQRVSVCNSAETLLVHKALADTLLPQLLGELRALGVEIRGCAQTLQRCQDAIAATEDDWREEYLDKILAVRVVDSMDQAIDHIRRYGSNHTEAIVTDDLRSAREFVRRVNSSSVFVNASTRFADGFQLGLGAEVGISTTKIHWYGPMGIEGLTTQKFIAFGDGTLIE